MAAIQILSPFQGGSFAAALQGASRCSSTEIIDSSKFGKPATDVRQCNLRIGYISLDCNLPPSASDIDYGTVGLRRIPRRRRAAALQGASRCSSTEIIDSSKFGKPATDVRQCNLRIGYISLDCNLPPSACNVGFDTVSLRRIPWRVALVSRVSGLSDLRFQPHSLRALNPQTGKPFPAVPLSATANGAFYSANCLQSPQLVNFSTDGGSPKATYYGNTYGALYSIGME